MGGPGAILAMVFLVLWAALWAADSVYSGRTGPSGDCPTGSSDGAADGHAKLTGASTQSARDLHGTQIIPLKRPDYHVAEPATLAKLEEWKRGERELKRCTPWGHSG